MPLQHKPRNPSYGVKQVRRKTGRRKMLHASILPETKAYLDATCKGTAPGWLIDEAMKLHAEYRHELPPHKPEAVKRLLLSTPVSQETLSYVRYMRDAMTPGELVDEAIRLYREIKDRAPS